MDAAALSDGVTFKGASADGGLRGGNEAVWSSKS